jgi:hypothetical protein
VADVDALGAYYGHGFHRAALDGPSNIELILKDEVLRSLKRATRGTSKGDYHKTAHAPEILKRIDPAKVRSRSHECNRLFTTLMDLFIGTQPL